MTIPAQDSASTRSVIDLDASISESSPRLNDYLQSASQEVRTLTERASRGEVIDRNSRDWMLAQVDFIVEVIGNESLDLGDELRSQLLQLLLAIANLNEQARQQSSLAL